MMIEQTPRFLKVADKPGLKRDTQNGAIINTQASDHDKYIQQRKIFVEQRQRMDHLEDKVNDIESGVNDIKQLLKQVLQKL